MKLLVDMEFVAALDSPAAGRGMAGGALVDGRPGQRAGRGNHGLRSGTGLRRIDEQGCVVLTHDMDFGAILAATHGEKPSVIQLRMEDVTPQMAGSRVLAALRHMEQELESGALLTVDRRQVRVRMLPLTF